MSVLDLKLPKRNCFEVGRRMREHLPQTKTMFISEDRSLAEEASQMRANSYVAKSDARGELVPALEAVLPGEQYVNLTVVRPLHPAVI